MKLLHVSASYLPATRYGGTIVSVHQLCRALAKRGHDVHVFTTSVDGNSDSAVPHGEAVDVEGVKVWYFRSSSARRIYYAPAMAAMLRQHIHEFTVVHTHAIYLWPLWKAARAAAEAAVPYVVSPRGMLEKDLIENKSALWKAALIGFIERRSLEQAAAIHVTSAREGDEARAFGFSLPPLCEIPNGVEAAGEEGAASDGIRAIAGRGPYVLYLGRINWKKGLDRLIRALPLAPAIRVVLAGDDEEGYRHVLESIAAGHEVADRIVFAGPVRGVDKAFLLRNARLLVLPSYSENFGNVVLEAMAEGRPVVVTPEVGAASLVREADAGVVVSGEPATLSAALARLFGDVEQANAMGARGRALTTRYSWDAVASRMETLYARVAAGQPGC
jgi:glycosyltransferase involved in cell wall biosynthesis